MNEDSQPDGHSAFFLANRPQIQATMVPDCSKQVMPNLFPFMVTGVGMCPRSSQGDLRESRLEILGKVSIPDERTGVREEGMPSPEPFFLLTLSRLLWEVRGLEMTTGNPR